MIDTDIPSFFGGYDKSETKTKLRRMFLKLEKEVVSMFPADTTKDTKDEISGVVNDAWIDVIKYLPGK